MNGPVVSHEEIYRQAASEIENQIRKDAAGLSPVEVETIVAMVLRFGPSVAKALLKLFRITKKG